LARAVRELSTRRHRLHAALTGSLLAISCSSGPVAEQQPPAPLAAIPCMPDTGSIAPENTARVDEVRRAAESGPLYSALAAASRLRSCRVVSQSEEVALEFAFIDGGTLRFVRNQAIEYADQEARFGGPSDTNGLELLQRTEKASFSPDGCGIDWADATRGAPAGGVTESAFYGDVCSCQARVRTDPANRVVSLAFRSTC
jgi:hypothetical protein